MSCTEANKVSAPAISSASVHSTPVSSIGGGGGGNGLVPANAMIAVAASGVGVAAHSSSLTPATPTSNVTVTTTAAMTQPHPPLTPQVMAHPGVPPSPIPQLQNCNPIATSLMQPIDYVFWKNVSSRNTDTNSPSESNMQVIQQPLHAPAYLQHIYNPNQQLITLQPASMSPSIQAFGAPVLGLPLLSAKTPGLEPKSSVTAATIKPMLFPSSSTVQAAGLPISTVARAANGPLLAPSPIFTANRQITPQMLAAGKPILQGQSNYIQGQSNQTLVIGQLGAVLSQPSLIPAQQHHAKQVGDQQKVKPFMMGQAGALQPKSPILPHPQAGTAVSGSTVTATATVLNSSQFKQMSQGATLVSTPQLITSQASQLIASQAQILNPLQALGPNYQGITWATPSGIQSPALLTQNPIFIRGQHQDMFLQSPPQQQQTLQQNPGLQIAKPKQVRPASSVATQTNVTTSLVQTTQVSGLRPQVKHRSKTQVTRIAPGPAGGVLNQKADAANQTRLTGPPTQQSTGSQTRTNHHVAVSSEPKQPIQKASVEIQASVPFSPKPPIAPVIAEKKSDQPDEPMDTTTDNNAVTTAITRPDNPPEANQQTNGNLVNCGGSGDGGHMQVVLQPPPVPVVPQSQPALRTLAPKPEEPSLVAVVTTTAATTTATASVLPSVNTTAVVTTTVSGNPAVTASTLMATDVQKEKHHPQKAIVKPHVLTHVIEGYVIQEGPEPFPVNRSSLLTESVPTKNHHNDKEMEDTDEVPSQMGEFVATPIHQPVLPTPPDPWKEGGKPTIIIKGLGKKKDRLEAEMAKCEFCGKLDEKKKFKRSKRFCSTSCAKRYNVGCSKRIEVLPVESTKSSKKHHGMKSRKSWRKSSSRSNVVETGEEWQNGGESSHKEETTDSHSGAESSLSPTTPTSQKDMEVDNPEPEPTTPSPPERSLPKSPLKWTVHDVYEFIKALPGCTDYADEFRIQEIDGQALLLLKEDHLMTAMNMKLGPALKICARINSLKEEVSRQ